MVKKANLFIFLLLVATTCTKSNKENKTVEVDPLQVITSSESISDLQTITNAESIYSYLDIRNDKLNSLSINKEDLIGTWICNGSCVYDAAFELHEDSVFLLFPDQDFIGRWFVRNSYLFLIKSDTIVLTIKSLTPQELELSEIIINKRSKENDFLCWTGSNGGIYGILKKDSESTSTLAGKWDFGSEGFSLYEEGSKYEYDGPEGGVGIWSFLRDQKQLVISEEGKDIITYDIVLVTNNRLVLKDGKGEISKALRVISNDPYSERAILQPRILKD